MPSLGMQALSPIRSKATEPRASFSLGEVVVRFPDWQTV
jgi:hypothetical protein